MCNDSSPDEAHGFTAVAIKTFYFQINTLTLDGFYLLFVFFYCIYVMDFKKMILTEFSHTFLCVQQFYNIGALK